jgi:hypothetical protein
MFLTSKLITGFIDEVTSKRISQSIAYLPNGSEYIYIGFCISKMKCTKNGLYGQTALKNASVRPWSRGRGSGFSGDAPIHHLGVCNNRWGYLERPVKAEPWNFGPLHTRAKSHDHEIVRAQKKASKCCPKTPPKSCNVVTNSQV